MKNIISIVAVMLIASHFLVLNATADEQGDVTYDEPNWYFGLAGAANLNFYEGTTHHLTNDLVLPATFHEGFGLKPNISALVEYRFDKMWGIKLNLGYDGRGGVFDKVMAPCELESELETNLGYFVIEPTIRFAPLRSELYLFAGPRFSINTHKDFTYKREGQHGAPGLTVEDEWSEIKSTLLSFQIGAAYDFLLSSPSQQIKYVLTPFVSFHPYFGQVPRDRETWNITGIRAGVALKIGRGKEVLPPVEIEPVPEVEPEPVVPEVTEPPVVFTARAPLPDPTLISNEIYPLRNYVFFEEGNRSIPGRYNLLSAAEAQGFTEGRILGLPGIRQDNHAGNQMIIYYNMLNILGDRMRNHPNTSVTLRGASAGQGQAAGRQQAESVKQYIVSVFDIAPERITTIGSDWPSARSFRHSQQTDPGLRLDSDRRVEILTADKELLMTDEGQQSGILKPVTLSWKDENILEDHVIFSLTNAERYMEEWYVELTDPDGQKIEYGPFVSSRESVPGYEILEKGSPGVYQVVMRGVSKEELEFSRESSVSINPELLVKEYMVHFSILFDIGMFETPAAYEAFLLQTVIPNVPDNARVIIHGHTDIIGNVQYNYSLSLQRARRAKELMEKALREHGIQGVEFEVYGLGELNEDSPFQNQYPEERFYNRTVIIDILPR